MYNFYGKKIESKTWKRVKLDLKNIYADIPETEGCLKYISLTKLSNATATTDLQHLEQQGALIRAGAGRSTSYYLPIAIKE